MKILSAIYLLIFILNTSSFSQWHIVHEDYVQRSFFEIEFVSEDRGFIAGDDVFATSTDGGRYWLTLNKAYGRILGLEFLDERKGVAVGETGTGYGFILITTNSGFNWNPVSGDIASVKDLFLLDNQNGWAVGNNGNIFKMGIDINQWQLVSSVNTNLEGVSFIDKNIGWAVGWNGLCIKTTDGGITWFEQETGVSSILWDVCFIDRDRGWVTTASNNQLLHTTDGGNTWTITTFPVALRTIQFLSDSIGFISGFGKILKTTDGGNTWNDIVTPVEAFFNDMEFINENIGFLVGGYRRFFKTTDGGMSWFPLKLGEYNNLNSIHMFDQSRGVAVGEDGTVLRTWTGDFWVSGFSNTYQKLNSVFALNYSDAVAVGDSGMILRGYYTYQTWVEKSSGVSKNLNSVFFINRDTGWIAGDDGVILKSTNRGLTWDLLNSGTTMDLNSISFTNQFYGWAAGDGGILKTTNGGLSWFQHNILNFNYYNIQLLDSYAGFVLGQNGRLFRTYDGGLNWDSIYTDQYDLNAISFYNIWEGWSCGQWGKIMRTFHMGEIWIDQYENLTLKFNSINTVDDQVCYVTGNNGVILRTLNGGAGIPVELISFTGLQENGCVYLNWQTATEKNNFMFEIQRKIEETEWLTIGYKPGTGTTTELKNYEYKDDCYGIPGGLKLKYRLKQIDFTGEYEYSSEITIEKLALNTFAIERNYPNPFNSSTTIKYSIPTKADVIIEIIDVLGKRVTLLVNETKNAGMYEAVWSANNVTSGIYFYRIKAGTFTDTKKMILLK